MAGNKLKYKMTNDILAKMIFVKYPDLLRRLVSTLLDIEYGSIKDFVITNPEIPPEVYGDKFCRLDISMEVNKQKIILELQVDDEGDYKERSLYYWAREYSTALKSGMGYKELPRTIAISIVRFSLFTCVEYHSEYRPLEVTRHELLTDKQVLHFFELPKVSKNLDAGDMQGLWLNLFNAQTEEEMDQLEKLGITK